VDALLNTAGVTLSNRQAMIDGLNNSTLTRAAVLRQIVESTEVSTRFTTRLRGDGILRLPAAPAGRVYLDWIRVLVQPMIRAAWSRGS